MYAYIKGKLITKDIDQIVIESNQIGYEIRVPIKIMEELPTVGEFVKIYTYLYVRDDAQLLYGFMTNEDKEVFKLLIGVSGIGPKGALAILSVLSCDDLRFAVMSDDIKAISQAQGVGKKTAQRLVIELKDKLNLQDTLDHLDAKNTNHELEVQSSIKKDAIAALVSLGYSSTDSARALCGIDHTDGLSTEDCIKYALKNIM